MDRIPTVAGMFYPAGEAACRREVEAFLRAVDAEAPERPIRAGLVPHAGWAYSGATAAHVFSVLAQQQAPETVILFGAVHSWGVSRPSVYPDGSWRTPLGPLAVDAELAVRLLAEGAGVVVGSADAHADEHSIEVQLPFVRHLFPEALILPIAVPPVGDAAQVGAVAAAAVRALGRRAVALGSTDLTHYGPRYGMAPAGVGQPGLRWARDNDARMLDLAVDLADDKVLAEARGHHNACGAGAVAAAIRFSRALGATQGQLLDYTTSYDVMPEGMPSDLVGYGAVIYY
ncbi:MAG: AmmeMemoRadiSam system protein B [Chloroflexi bacterium]|jgi:AmmeMemoRadiSam system protein B|nr:AmmeMemoRadiSam system protein B [Chloroflexota bacterium]